MNLKDYKRRALQRRLTDWDAVTGVRSEESLKEIEEELSES